MRSVLVITLLVAIVAAAAMLAGCAASDHQAAIRANAESALLKTEGDVYEQKQSADADNYARKRQADVDAEAGQAAIRQGERDAAHQRALETLPYLVVIAGTLLLAGLGGLIFWDLRRQPRPAPAPAQQAPTQQDPTIYLYLERMRLEAAERDRALWHAIGSLARQRRIEESRHEMVVRGRR